MTDPAFVVADAVLSRVARDYGGPRKVAATVLEFEYLTTSAIALPYARVHIDGDPPGEIRTVPVEMPAAVTPGQRVIITYDPPHGAGVTGFAGIDATSQSGGGARPYATRVVAAANSIATDAANADYICAGTGTDDVTIQAALDDLDSVGGTVVLLEGSYYCASGPDAFTPSILIDNNQILRGQGRSNTFLYFDAGDTLGLYNGGVLRDVTITLGTPGGGGGGE